MFNAFLVPWDAYPPEQRPPNGTWQREMNDFFETSILTALPVLIFFAVSITGRPDEKSRRFYFSASIISCRSTCKKS